MAAVIALALAASLCLSSPAAAQDPTAQSEEARVLFERAVEELRRGQFPSARDHLRRSLDLFPTAGTAFNLALALNGTGQTVEAVRLLEQLEAGEFGELRDAERTQVAELLVTARADLARLRVTIRGPTRARIRIDGDDAGEATAEQPLELTTNAGRHVIAAAAPGHRATDEVVDLTRGESRALSIALSPLPPARTPAPPVDDGTLWESPWTWLTLGALILGGAAAVYLATQDRTADPISDPVFGIAQVLRY